MSGQAYKLDTFKIGDEEYLSLTRKNANFIEAAIHYDSNYGWGSDPNEKPDDEYKKNFEKPDRAGKHYYGSVAAWAEEIKLSTVGESFENALLGFIICIDITNSTHLEACVDGGEEMRKIIIESGIDDCDSLIKAISSNQDKDGLFYKMLRPIEKKESEKSKKKRLAAGKPKEYRMNLSFTSKFFSYASEYILNGRVYDGESYFLGYLKKDIGKSNAIMKKYLKHLNGPEYPRYDGIVSGILNKYVKEYLNEKKAQKEYKKDGLKTQDDYFDMYFGKYMKDLLRIQQALLESEDRTSLSLSEIDHIIWYGNK